MVRMSEGERWECNLYTQWTSWQKTTQILFKCGLKRELFMCLDLIYMGQGRKNNNNKIVSIKGTEDGLFTCTRWLRKRKRKKKGERERVFMRLGSLKMGLFTWRRLFQMNFILKRRLFRNVKVYHKGVIYQGFHCADKNTNSVTATDKESWYYKRQANAEKLALSATATVNHYHAKSRLCVYTAICAVFIHIFYALGLLWPRQNSQLNSWTYALNQLS